VYQRNPGRYRQARTRSRVTEMTGIHSAPGITW
jgi:hypothetical protein